MGKSNKSKSIHNPSDLWLSEEDIYITVKENRSAPLKEAKTLVAATLIVLGVPCERRESNKQHKFTVFGGASSAVTQLEWTPTLPNTSSSGATPQDAYAVVCREFKTWEIFRCLEGAHVRLLRSQLYEKLPNHSAFSSLRAGADLGQRVGISEGASMLSLAAHDFRNGTTPFPQLVHYRGSNPEDIYTVTNRNENASMTGLCSLFVLEVLLHTIFIFILLFNYLQGYF